MELLAGATCATRAHAATQRNARNTIRLLLRSPILAPELAQSAGQREEPMKALASPCVIRFEGNATHRVVISLLTACFTLLTSTSAFADRVYTVTLPGAGGVTVSGTITTNGNVGILSVADLVDFDLVVSSPSFSITQELLGPGHGGLANTAFLRFEGVLASETTLFLQPLSQPPCGFRKF
jgi:hypothetical protein